MVVAKTVKSAFTTGKVVFNTNGDSSRIRTFYSVTEYHILCTLHLYSGSTLGSNLHLIIWVTSRIDLKNVIYSVSTLGSTLGMSSFLANAIMIMVLQGTLGKFPTLETRVESPYTTGVIKKSCFDCDGILHFHAPMMNQLPVENTS